MGLSYSRKIYDPENRNLDMKDISEKYKVIISEWYKEGDKLVCDETTNLSADILRVNYKEMYEVLQKLGLKGIDRKNEVYEFIEKW